MPYALSVWLDDKTAKALETLCYTEERKRGDMVKVLIRRAIREYESRGINDLKVSSATDQQGLLDDN